MSKKLRAKVLGVNNDEEGERKSKRANQPLHLFGSDAEDSDSEESKENTSENDSNNETSSEYESSDSSESETADANAQPREANPDSDSDSDSDPADPFDVTAIKVQELGIETVNNQQIVDFREALAQLLPEEESIPLNYIIPIRDQYIEIKKAMLTGFISTSFLQRVSTQSLQYVYDQFIANDLKIEPVERLEKIIEQRKKKNEEEEGTEQNE